MVALVGSRQSTAFECWKIPQGRFTAFSGLTNPTGKALTFSCSSLFGMDRQFKGRCGAAQRLLAETFLRQ